MNRIEIGGDFVKWDKLQFQTDKSVRVDGNRVCVKFDKFAPDMTSFSVPIGTNAEEMSNNSALSQIIEALLS